jgi:subtilase family serine protease
MRSWKLLLPLLASTVCFAAQPDRIAGTIDSSQMVALPRSVNPKAQPRYDQGPVESSLQFGYVTLVVGPSPSQQMALEQLLAQQQDRSSPNYHKWLTPEQYAACFGLNQNDVAKITAWLTAEGFTVLSVPRGRNEVIFSGTAVQIQSAFSTEIHRYTLKGEMHVANSTAISVPASLSGIVTSIRGIADFRPKPMYVRPVSSGKSRGPHPSYTTTLQGNTDYFLAPGDIATIYDLNPLYSATTPIDGTGEKLAIIGQTDVYLADLADFRTGFGLNPITGCTTNANGVVTACNSTPTNYFQYVLVPGITDPGTPSTCGDIFESDLDIEWSGAIAKNAQIVFVNAPATFNTPCTEYTNNGGVNVALAYAIQENIAPVVSLSYGSCEDGNDSMETELTQANSQGMTIMNSAGDTGSAACDNSAPNFPTRPYAAAEFGASVNYPASSPEVTGVGGTSIPLADYTSTYWNSNGSSTVDFGGSALTTLIGQEAAWNDNEIFAQVCNSDPSNVFCTKGGSPAVSGWVDITSAETAQEDLWISSGGGGVSNCFNYDPTTFVCTSGLPRPSWQLPITIPNLTSPASTYRFVPDVSLLASPNYPGYILCTPQNALTGTGTVTTSSCAGGIASAVDTYESLVGGTSVSSPVFAGIIALINQYLGSTTGLGNINPTLYSLAATPSNGAFHQITSGDNDVYCQENTPAGNPADVICPSTGATPGVFGFSTTNFDSTGGTGYNLANGLGSVDANNLAIAWSGTSTGDFALGVAVGSPSSLSTPAGQSTTTTLTVTLAGGTSATVNFKNNMVSPTGTTTGSCTGLPTGAGCVFTNPSNPSSPTSFTLSTANPTATVTLTITTLANIAASGPTAITITPTGSTQTASVNLTMTATQETFTISSPSNTYSVNAGGTAPVTLNVAGTNGFIVGSGTAQTTALPVTYTCTQSSLPSEASCSFSPTGGNSVSATAVTLNITTSAPTGQLHPPLGRGSQIFYALLLPGLFGMVFAAGSRSRSARLLGLIVVLGFSTLWLGACGGNTNSSQKNPGTPAGTYSIVVNATTGGAVPITSSYTVMLTVLN